MEQNKADILKNFSESFKKNGFAKTKQTWKKTVDRLTFVCNLQNSQWDDKGFYINIGILIDEIIDVPHMPFGHIYTRIEPIILPEHSLFTIFEWFGKYNSVKKIVDDCRKYHHHNSLHNRREVLDNLSKKC